MDYDEKISLLWPDGHTAPNTDAMINHNDSTYDDLGLEYTVRALSISSTYTVTVESVLPLFSSDPRVIKYRLEVIEDLLANPSIVSCFEQILPRLGEIFKLGSTRGHADITPLQQTVWRLGELDMYTECVTSINQALENSCININSEALCKLRDVIREIAGEETFISLVLELPKLKSGLRNLASVTIGVNLDPQLRAVEATLLSINEKRFKGESIISRFISNKAGKSEYQGISPLLKVENLATSAIDPPVYDAFQITLFKEINSIMGTVAKPVASSIAQYIRINGSLLAGLAREIVFLLGAVKLIKKIRSSGLPICKPEILPAEDRVFKVEDIYNLNLALQMIYKKPDTDLRNEIVTNTADIGENGRIQILTGPNRGGKTTYTQAIGIAQLLFQLGLFIPGSKAAITPVDRIFTHFPVQEKPDSNLGRLGEETKRLNEIFHQATRNSMILLNESLSSTSSGEGLYISREVVAGLKLLGVRAIFATHFHDLAENLDKMNAHIPGDSQIISMVSCVDQNPGENGDEAGTVKRTYRIIPGPPQGISYARDIASKYGIGIKEIMKTLKDRKIVEEDTVQIPDIPF